MTKARDLANAGTALTTVSATELGYLDGVTSAVQTQLNAKQAVVSGVNDTEIGYLDGVTSAIQTQLDAKIPKTLTTTTGDIIYASGANTPARLGIGSTGNVLTVSGGVPVWSAPAGGGKVLQVVSATYSTQFSTTSSSYVDTGLTASITPSASTSKILVLASNNLGATRTGDDCYYAFQVLRGSTVIYQGNANEGFAEANQSSNLRQFWNTDSISYLDSPATTSSTTYKMTIRAVGGSTAYAQYNNNSGPSIILLEIGA